MVSSTVANVRPFFEAASVAIIGASRTPGKAGYNIIDNMLRFGYKGRIYPVNPGAETILAQKVYPDIAALPEAAELAVIVLPPPLVLPALKQCVAKGIKHVIVETAGFAETDANGALLEKRMARLAREAGMRVMGPNSVGTINPSTRLITSFPHLKTGLGDRTIAPGSIGFIAQTGLFTITFLPLIESEMEMSKVACLGNKCDVDECDMLEYLAGDPQTKVIAMYLESIKDGRRFFRLCRQVVKEKPVVILKSATTAYGARVSASHTGSMAGEDRVYDTAFRQLGVIRAEGFDQLFDIAKTFLYCPMPAGNRVAILSTTGAGCVTAADACARSGLAIASLAVGTVQAARTVYPDWWQVKNPVDVLTALETSGFARGYGTLTRLVLKDPGVDAAVLVLGAVDFVPGKDVTQVFKDFRREFPDKPLLLVNMLGDRLIYDRMCRSFKSFGIPSYTSVEGAVGALGDLWRYRQFRETA